MESEGCDRRGRQQRSETESMSSCMTAVLAWYIEPFNSPANAAGMKTISALQTFYLILPLPFLLLPLYPIFPPPCLMASVGLAMVCFSLVNYNLWSWPLFWNTLLSYFCSFFFSLRSPFTLLGTTFLSDFFPTLNFTEYWSSTHRSVLWTLCSFLYSSRRYENLFCQTANLNVMCF